MKSTQVVAYSLFRADIVPEWEHPINQVGSEWGCRDQLTKEAFEHMWNELVFAAIGERIPHCVGVRAINKTSKVRCMYKVEVWMDTTKREKVAATRQAINGIVQTPCTFTLLHHQDKQEKAFEFQKRRRKPAENES